MVGPVRPKTGPAGLGSRKRGLRARRDHPTLLLGERGVQVQHERVGIDAEFGDDERHTLAHQPRDKRHVARKAVELRDDNGATVPLRLLQGRTEFGTTVESICPLPRLDLDMAANHLEALSLAEAGDGRLLGLQTEPRATLPRGGNPKIRDNRTSRCNMQSLVCLLQVYGVATRRKANRKQNEATRTSRKRKHVQPLGHDPERGTDPRRSGNTVSVKDGGGAMNVRKPKRALDAHEVRDFLEGVHFATKIGHPLNDTITLHPGYLMDPAADPWPEFVRLLNLLRIWFRRRRHPYCAAWVRENYARTAAEHLHVLIYVRPKTRDALVAALASWFPSLGAVQLDKAEFGRDERGGRYNKAATYVLKQMTPQAAFSLSWQVRRETRDRRTGDKVAAVLGKRCGLSQSLDRKAREAFYAVPLAARPAPAEVGEAPPTQSEAA